MSEEIKGKWDTGLGQVGGCRPGRKNNRYIDEPRGPRGV